MGAVHSTKWAYQDWFAQGGFPDGEVSCEYAYAERLCRYITSPSTIRVRTLDRFGVAPPMRHIEQMRSAWVRKCQAKIDNRFTYGITLEEKRDAERLEWRAKNPPLAIARQEPEPIKNDELPRPARLNKDAPLRFADDVIEVCAEVCGITYGELVGSCRKRPYMRARGLAAAVLKARGNSLPKVGRFLHRNDHSSVINCIQKFFDRDIADADLLAAWEAFAPNYAKHCRSYEELLAVLKVRQ